MSALIDLSLGTVSPDLAPVDEAWKAPLTSYAPRGGLPQLRAVLAQLEGVGVDCLTMTCGASMALTAAFAIVPKRRVVAIPRPYYPAYPRLAQYASLQPRFYEVSPGATLTDAIEARTSSGRIGAILVNSPGNPLGNVICCDDMAALEELAARLECLLIVDETYAGIILEPDDGMWAGRGTRPNVIRIKSLSKSQLLAGDRIGYVVADPALVVRIEDAHWTMAMTASISGQVNAAQALLQRSDTREADLCASLLWSRDSALEALCRTANVTLAPPKAGVFLWIELPGASRSGSEIARECLGYGVNVMPGEAFGARKPSIRANFALPQQSASLAFHKLANALCDMGVAPLIHRNHV